MWQTGQDNERYSHQDSHHGHQQHVAVHGQLGFEGAVLHALEGLGIVVQLPAYQPVDDGEWHKCINDVKQVHSINPLVEEEWLEQEVQRVPNDDEGYPGKDDEWY